MTVPRQQPPLASASNASDTDSEDPMSPHMIIQDEYSAVMAHLVRMSAAPPHPFQRWSNLIPEDDDEELGDDEDEDEDEDECIPADGWGPTSAMLPSLEGWIEDDSDEFGGEEPLDEATHREFWTDAEEPHEPPATVIHFEFPGSQVPTETMLDDDPWAGPEGFEEAIRRARPGIGSRNVESVVQHLSKSSELSSTFLRCFESRLSALRTQILDGNGELSWSAPNSRDDMLGSDDSDTCECGELCCRKDLDVGSDRWVLNQECGNVARWLRRRISKIFDEIDEAERMVDGLLRVVPVAR